MKKLIVLGVSIFCVLSFTMVGCDDGNTCNSAAKRLIKFAIAEGELSADDGPQYIEDYTDLCEGNVDEDTAWTQEQIDCVASIDSLEDFEACDIKS